ncbi:hypothetical protein APZ41_005270 [Roseomonas mucosa]|uniref:Transporter n=2 Tax=Roseomonas mucosa TaxID=207340 RepID=A0A1S8DA49_9PROT|nr:hypothetical protein APZ41_005270 [Roseomonas mucosa]
MTKLVAAGLAASATLALGLPAARAADHNNLEENLPTRIEDAYVTPYNGIEAQSFFGYDRSRVGRRGRGGSDVFTLGPRIEMGLFRNFQASVAVPYRVGNGPDTQQGDFDVQTLYNLNSEGVRLPALSLGVGVDQPFGAGNGGTETSVKFVATKSIGSIGTSYVPRRLHLNAAWFHNYDPIRSEDGRERRDRYLVGIGYSQPISNDAVLVADIYRETLRDSRRAENMVEVGARYQLTPQTVLSGSIGTGIAERSPAVRVVVGVQHTLSWPLLFR